MGAPQSAGRHRSAPIRNSKIEKALFSIPAQCQGIGQGKRYYLRTYGCQANERDSETLAGILEALQFQPTEDVQEADLILMNTCAVRKNAEDKVLGEIGHFKHLARQREDLVIGVCGCMAQEENIVETLLTKYRHVNLIFGTHNLHRLPELLYQVMVGHETCVEVYSKEGDVIENLPVRRFGRHKAWVNIMYGCDKFCTYCIVPYTRGKERSRPDGGHPFRGAHAEGRRVSGDHAAGTECQCLWQGSGHRRRFCPVAGRNGKDRH